MKKLISRRKSENHLDTYFKLVKEFPLVSIKNEKQLALASRFLDHVLNSRELDSGEQEYLDALTDLIECYEEEHCKFPSVTAAALLAHLIEARCVTQADVARETGISRSVISEILKGKRRIALAHMGRLARYFRVPASVFLTDEGTD